MENNGYIALHRKMLDNPIVCKDNDYFRVWLQLLLSATHKRYSVVFAGQRTELKAGQLITGRKTLAEKCNISESKVQRILKSFEIEQQIEQQTCNKNRLITIVNWSLYQNCERQNERQLDNKRTATEQQANTNNNGNNDNNVDNGRNKDLVFGNPPFTGEMLVKVQEWLQYKKERRQSYKPTGLAALYKQLQNEAEKHGENFVISVIDKSIVNNWQGLFFDGSKAIETQTDDSFLRVARGENI